MTMTNAKSLDQESRRAILRVLDANANRVREGLRVAEDFARLVADDQPLTAILKGVRHDVTSAIQELAADSELRDCRDSLNDVGTEIEEERESVRRDMAGIVSANLKRAEEGLRVLEEFAKLLVPGAGQSFKSLRFKLYAVEKELMNKAEVLHDTMWHPSVTSAEVEFDHRGAESTEK